MRGQDISYGRYLVHFVILNCAFEFGWDHDYTTSGLVVLLAVIAATLSWRVVERPALALKSKARASSPGRRSMA